MYNLWVMGSYDLGLFSSRCVACVLIDVVLVWLTAGLYMGTMVASSDLCMDPTEYINEYTAANVGQSGLGKLPTLYQNISGDQPPTCHCLTLTNHLMQTKNRFPYLRCGPSNHGTYDRTLCYFTV